MPKHALRDRLTPGPVLAVRGRRARAERAIRTGRVARHRAPADSELYSHWEMFWPVVTLLAICAAPMGWAFAPLIHGG